jgi:hypothetical protein
MNFGKKGYKSSENSLNFKIYLRSILVSEKKTFPLREQLILLPLLLLLLSTLFLISSRKVTTAGYLFSPCSVVTLENTGECTSNVMWLFFFFFLVFVRLLALRPLLAYCASLG